MPDNRVISVAILFDHVTTLARQNWQKSDIELTCCIVPQALDINVDTDMIEQILLNLLQNAEHALAHLSKPIAGQVSKQGGTQVATAKISLKAFLNVRGHVVIEVADNGKGFEDENIAQIFVPFFTTKKEG
ncbi:ATP-binding protein [Colwellia sp. TT2012]|uniref:ATP-binding protein n=1 Tax=Colwellia sp. TT2012 TaxID=1720342 RepID=UPI000708CDE6|nr:ATP-binding protein [Colwellia sp. TT2012]